jgi:transposase
VGKNSATFPTGKEKKLKSQPRMDDRKAMTVIFYILRTGYQWNALPRTLEAPACSRQANKKIVLLSF